MKRVLTAAIITPFFFWAVVYSPYWVFLPTLAAVALICFHEYLGIVNAHFPKAPDPRHNPAGYIAGLLLLIIPWYDMGAFLVMFALLAFLFTLKYEDLSTSLPIAACVLMGVVYVFGSWRCGVALRELSPWWLLFALVVNWVGDTFAYFTGKAIGRHKLAPSVSPGKSWEGTFGSIASSVVLGPLLLHWGFPKLDLPGVEILPAVILSLVANIAGQLGDLAESAIKRGAGVKDSGTSLPGHGGWLDRVDSSLFSIPVVYWLIQLRWFVP